METEFFINFTRIVIFSRHRNFSTNFDNLVARSGLPRIRFHDLRHFAISYMINELGIPLSVVQSIVGHASPVLTLNIYTHASTQQQNEVPPQSVVDNSLNLSIRQWVSKLTRRTWGPARFTPELMEHLEWWRAYYHFVRYHASLEEELT